MTEQEAKQTWCPMARCADGGINRNADGSAFSYMGDGTAPKIAATCIASACQWWRWDFNTMQMETDEKGICFRTKKDGLPRGYCAGTVR